MKSFFLFLVALSIVSFGIFLLFFKETYLYQGSLHLFIISLAMYFLWKKDLATTMQGIGFPGGLKNTAKYYCVGLIVIVLMMLIIGITSILLGFNDQYKIQEKVLSLPLYIILLAVVFAPFSEELLFRGYLSTRFGIIPSSLLFGILHFSYGSIVEIIGVTMIGILLALIYRHSKSITPCILIHLTYNLFSFSIMRLLS